LRSFTDDVQDIHDQESLSVWNVGQLDGSLQQVAFVKRRIEDGWLPTGLVSEMVGRGIDDHSPSLAENGDLADSGARNP
jgi:hypothetical protein